VTPRARSKGTRVVEVLGAARKHFGYDQVTELDERDDDAAYVGAHGTVEELVLEPGAGRLTRVMGAAPPEAVRAISRSGSSRGRGHQLLEQRNRGGFA
jgi:hypothetical protein